MKAIRELCLLGLLAAVSIGCGAKSPTGEKESQAQPANPETEEDGLKALSGEWRVASIQNLPPSNNLKYHKKVTGRIEGKRLKLSQSIGYLKDAEIRLDPTKSPKQFDLIALEETGKPQTIKYFTTGGPNDGKQLERPVETVRGIYTLKGDQLTIAITDRENYRPTEFKASVMENTGGFVTVNKRGATHVVVVQLNRIGSEADKKEKKEPEEPLTEHELVESVVQPFCEALKARDYARAMKETSLPFLGGTVPVQRRIESTEELRKELEQFVNQCEKSKDLPTNAFDAEHWIPDMFSESNKKYYEPMRQVAGQNGIISSIGVKQPNGGLHMSGKKVIIKMNNGKPKIVGLFNF